MAIAWIEIIIAVLLIGVILMQVRGSGTTLFGQADSAFRVRRGIERILFRATIVLAALFVIIAVLSVRLS
ncbi:MAG: preprotein translocase subunit SecG [Gemmatimonadetes bacterium]|nr:preprotein translocase subunit SecG [Gemmatimonadota bacterium]